jgi:hypothetical protein
LVVNLSTCAKRGGPVEKKFPDFGRVRDTTSTRRRPGWLPRPAKTASTAQEPFNADRFVDNLLNIHRIECAKPPCGAPTNFLSSFDPIQKQGLCNGFRPT